jgi:hypothetical protein
LERAQRQTLEWALAQVQEWGQVKARLLALLVVAKVLASNSMPVGKS